MGVFQRVETSSRKLGSIPKRLSLGLQLSAESQLPWLPGTQGGDNIRVRGDCLAKRDRIRNCFGRTSRGVWTGDECGIANQTSSTKCHLRYSQVEDRLNEGFMRAFK